jgi:hypothetical protein
MTMLFQEKHVGTSKQILAIPDHYVGLAQRIAGNDPAVWTDTATGRRWLRAGTFWPANGATCEGIILNDHEVIGNHDNNVTLVVHGFVNLAKLPVAPVAATRTALPLVMFVGTSPTP